MVAVEIPTCLLPNGKIEKIEILKYHLKRNAFNCRTVRLAKVFETKLD